MIYQVRIEGYLESIGKEFRGCSLKFRALLYQKRRKKNDEKMITWFCTHPTSTAFVLSREDVSTLLSCPCIVKSPLALTYLHNHHGLKSDDLKDFHFEFMVMEDSVDILQVLKMTFIKLLWKFIMALPFYKFTILPNF